MEPQQDKEMAFETSYLIPQMSPDEIDFESIEMQVLKVHIHCDGCKRKVKKTLRKFEGVFEVDIDKEQHKVTVTGTADIDTLIKKLIKSGKHAEIWPPTSNKIQSSNDWFSNFKNLKNIPMMASQMGLETEYQHYLPMAGPKLGFEKENEGDYSGLGVYNMRDRRSIGDSRYAYDGKANILNKMMPMMNINELSSFNYLSTMVNNRTIPTMLDNMGNRVMPQYMQETNNMNNMNWYIEEMNNMNNKNRYIQEINNTNNKNQYIQEMNNMNNRGMARYVGEMNNMNNQGMARYVGEMNNTNNHLMPHYMEEMKNMNSYVMPPDMQGNQFFMMNYGSPFLPDYYTAPYPYRYNYNHNGFI